MIIWELHLRQTILGWFSSIILHAAFITLAVSVITDENFWIPMVFICWIIWSATHAAIWNSSPENVALKKKGFGIQIIKFYTDSLLILDQPSEIIQRVVALEICSSACIFTFS